MAYSYDRRAAANPVAEWDLEGLTNGTPVTLYHGTTRTFRTFDPATVRDELVNKFYGRGIFLTPAKRVAVQYAEANRNIGFPPSIINDLSRRNQLAGKLMQAIYVNGPDGWETFLKENGFWTTDDPKFPNGRFNGPSFDASVLGGIDPNDVQEVTDYIIGSASKPLQDTGFVNIFDTSTGMPGYVYNTLDTIGINSKIYRPKVYTVTVTARNPLVTKNKSLASKARAKGYDAVIYHGTDLVGGVPEVAIFDPRAVKVRKIEVID